MQSVATIPMRSVGPVLLTGSAIDEAVMVPLATFETPLWPSCQRGARATRHSGGIEVTITTAVVAPVVVGVVDDNIRGDEKLTLDTVRIVLAKLSDPRLRRLLLAADSADSNCDKIR